MHVSYDHRALLIDGERTLVLSGAVHYPRSTPAMWPGILRHMRQSGLNTVETYVFWNLHERKRGVLDFSDRLDLPLFCRLAQAEGLHVILRIGPYICAETNYGGFPVWLRDVPDIQMRTDSEPFKREKARWVRLVSELVRPLCAPNGGPIILAQIENEYDNIAATYGEAGQRYLQWSVELAQSLELDIPWMTCAAGRAAEAGEEGAVASAGNSLETLNAFRAHEIIDRHFATHPGKPALWTENWIGWYQTWGGVLPQRDPAELAYSTARFFAAGGSGVNYYLWHGGTNFNRESMYLGTTSFEFGGALDEYGLPSTKARALAPLNRALLACSNELLGSSLPQRIETAEGLVEYRYHSGLVFHCDDRKKRIRITRSDGRELLYNSGSKITPIVRTWKSAGVRFSPWKRRDEPLPAHWPAGMGTPLVVSKPVEQLTLTHDETDYCWYETDLTVSASQARGVVGLRLGRAADIVHVFIDGHFIATTATPLRERRGKMNAGLFTQAFTLNLKAHGIRPGRHRLSLLACALGLIKGDWMIGYANMAGEKKGLWAPVSWDGTRLTGPWRHQAGLLGEHAGYMHNAGSLLDWTTPTRNNPKPVRPQPLSWWRTTFGTPKSKGRWAFDLAGMGKGLIWVNGRCLGRYWLLPDTDPMGPWMGWMQGSLTAVSSGGPTQRHYHVPAVWLHTDGRSNSLVLFEETGGDPTSIRLLRRI
jgi:beta-galactosidase